MIGYKGFSSDWKGLSNFQYEIGKTYRIEDSIILGEKGFHFCRYPEDVLLYYNQENDKYAVVQVSGQIIEQSNNAVTSEITIIRELTLENLKCLLNGKIQRVDGTEEWYENGKLHRMNGPAVTYSDGTKIWYQKGMMHRLDGPAIIFANGDRKWYKWGKLHCENSPACSYISGENEWWIEGKRKYVLPQIKIGLHCLYNLFSKPKNLSMTNLFLTPLLIYFFLRSCHLTNTFKMIL
jgi:hypothetical protein